LEEELYLCEGRLFFFMKGDGQVLQHRGRA
jgi:hypothetical protein